ncbi:kinase-like domain-containing protein [Xylaria intraflava]|nr:kinase-like domain-containing protein [Xylaria intraflava]
MSDTDIIAHLYPGGDTGPFDPAAFAIAIEQNKQRFVIAQPLVSYSHQGQETTPDPENNGSLDYLPSLKIDLSQIPKTSFGLVAGWDPKADIVLPKLRGVSFHHFSLTFDDAYRLIVRDLGSREGTCVAYGTIDNGPWSNFIWTIGGDEDLKNNGEVTIKVTKELRFQMIVKEFDPTSEDFRAKVDRFCAGTAGLEGAPEGPAVRPPPQTPPGTPAEPDILLMRKIGEGGFAVVNHVWNVRTGECYALKEPWEALRKSDLKIWENERRLTSRASHDHIVKILGSETGPTPSLRLEYLRGGSLRQHLREGRYFSGLECNQITRQILSALTYLHELKPPITHRDLSDGNILVHRRSADEIIVKLGDFGLSEEGLQLNTTVGTPYFFPPEFYQTISNTSLVGAKYTPAIDIWSLAVVVAKLLCGLPKYADAHSSNGRLWCEDIRRRVGEFFRVTKDALAQLLLDAMLCMEPEMREAARECHHRSTLLLNGSRHTWKSRFRVPGFYDGDGEERGGGQGEGERTLVPGNQNTATNAARVTTDHDMEGVTTDPGTNDDDSSDQSGSRVSEDRCSVVSAREAHQRELASSILSSNRTGQREMCGVIFDPDDSLGIRTDIDDESRFFSDSRSNPRTETST